MSSDGTTPIQDPTAATTEPVDIGHARQLGAAPPEGSMGEKVGIRLRNPTDIPVPGRYGTGKRTDFAVWRPSDGTWRSDRQRDAPDAHNSRTRRAGSKLGPARRRPRIAGPPVRPSGCGGRGRLVRSSRNAQMPTAIAPAESDHREVPLIGQHRAAMSSRCSSRPRREDCGDEENPTNSRAS
jgi:hypothetical protein